MPPTGAGEPRRSRQGDAVAHVRAFVDCGLMVDPWLGGLAERRVQPAAERLLRETAAELSARYWHPAPGPARPAHAPARADLGFDAAFHVLIVTAAVIAHERVGRISVSPAMAEESRRRLEAFIGRRGFRAAVWAYDTVTRFEQLGALQYYGGLPEAEFVRGRHRRPWVDEPMNGELERGLRDGDFRRVLRDGEPWIEPTPAGAKSHADMRQVLAEGGFLNARMQLALVSELNLIPDYEAIRRRMVPLEMEWRRSFSEFACIQPGAHVLEIGPAPDAQVFDGGLLEAVGPLGRVTGASPSVAMIDRARTKARSHGASNVKFVRSYLDELPFPDRRFDVTLAVDALRRPEAHHALAEMIRVTHPGGLVVHGAGCALDDAPEWLIEWMAPILQRAGSVLVHPLPSLPRQGDVARWFADAGLLDVESQPSQTAAVLDDPEASAIMVLRTDPLAQAVLGGLPWDAAQEVMEEFMERARAIFQRLSPEERQVIVPIEAVRGRVPPAAE